MKEHSLESIRLIEPETLSIPIDLEPFHRSLHEKIKNGIVGFFDEPERVNEAQMAAMITEAKRLRSQFGGALCLGIGGSHLGPSVITDTLRSMSQKNEFPMEWISNVDPDSIDRAEFSLQKPMATLVISKSGETMETLSVFFHFLKKLDPKGIVVITDPKKGELRKLAKARGWTSFDVPENVGGRFSVLTPVGLFPAALAGINSREIVMGARTMREQLQKLPIEKNPAIRLALLFWYWNTQKKLPLQVWMAYGKTLRGLADWNIQLWAESLGKKTAHGKGVGFTPIAASGTSDHHSILQLLKEGPQDKLVIFLTTRRGPQTVVASPGLEVSPPVSFVIGKRFDSILQLSSAAVEKSLQGSKVPTLRVELSEITPHTLGAYFFFMEYACAFAAELYGVDAFGQPGVEEAKKLLRSMLEPS